MLDNLSLTFKAKTVPLLSQLEGVPGVLSSNDLSIVRIYTQIPGEEKSFVFSKVLFLSAVTYEHWKKNELAIINERFKSVDYRRDRFILGLEAVEAYLENRTIDIDDKDAISKIRNYIVNIRPSSDKLTHFIEQSIKTLRNILTDDDKSDDFERISGFNFTPPDPEDELTDFLLLPDDILTSLETDFLNNDLRLICPSDEDSLVTLFNSHEERNQYLSSLSDLNNTFDKYVSLRKQRIVQLLADGFFQRQQDENSLQASEIPPNAKIIRTIEDETKICNKCLTETSSKFCQNIQCHSVLSEATIYTLPVDINTNMTVLNYQTVSSPYTNLSTLGNAHKQNMIALYAQEFTDLLSHSLMESEASLSICTRNISHHSFSAEKELAKSELSKTAFLADSDDIRGTNLHFWDYFISGSNIYAIIQHEDEIKTPTLVNDTKSYLSKRKRAFNIDINENYYLNTILYVVTDLFGQIKTCREGILDTSNPSKTLLSLGTSQFADNIRLHPTSVRPHISNIMYVPISTPENYVYKDKGKHLLKMLNVKDLSRDDLAEKPEEYRFSRRFFYRLAQGYIVYESLGSLVKFNSLKIPQTIGSGAIDKIRYTRIKEAISYKNFVQERINLGIQFVKNFMFSPDKSSNIFYSNFNKTRSLKTKQFRELIFEKNSLIDCIYFNKHNNILLNEQSPVSKPSTYSSISYPSNHLEAYRITHCTPFFMDELFAQPIVNDIIFTIHYNQGNTKNPKINNLSPFEPSFNYNISDFLPMGISLSKDKVVTKQLLQNGLRSHSQEDIFTISLSIILSDATDFYELTLFEKYLSENGIHTQNKTKDYLKISVCSGDILAFIL